MSKAYSAKWVENLAIRSAAWDWANKGLLTDAQYKAIEVAYPENFYRPPIYVKIGLFIFTMIAAAFFVGLLPVLLPDSSSRVAQAIEFGTCGLLSLFLMEYLIRQKKLFHCGTDNALLYIAMAGFAGAFFVLFDDLEMWHYWLFAVLIALPATIRYADPLAALLLFTAVHAVVFFILLKDETGRLLLPFAFMLLSAFVFALLRNTTGSYYAFCRKEAAVASLVTIYLAGNHLIVDSLQRMISNNQDLQMDPASSIVFFITTIMIPLTYIGFGLAGRNRILLITGLVTCAFSFYTFSYYFSILSVAEGLTVAGAGLILISALIIRLLRTPKFGITDEVYAERKLPDLGAIIIGTQLGQTPDRQHFRFGGGDFGGGGAGEKY